MRSFNEEKAIQVLSYISKKGFEDYLPILKIVFFAERYSLRKYCISILSDDFYAMKDVPVASKTYDILKSTYKFSDVNLYKAVIPTSEYKVEIEYSGDYDLLSVSDTEALDFSISVFGSRKRYLSNISHSYPEWYNCESKLKDGAKRVHMNYLDFFTNPSPERESELRKYLRKEDPFKDDNIVLSKTVFMDGTCVTQ